MLEGEGPIKVNRKGRFLSKRKRKKLAGMIDLERTGKASRSSWVDTPL